MSKDWLHIYETELGLVGKNLRRTVIDPNLLNNDHLHYQRYMQEDRVIKLMKDHKDLGDNPHGLVAKRSDGSLWVINGQHHGEACRRIGKDDAPFMMFDSPGWQFEKQVFDVFQKYQKSHWEEFPGSSANPVDKAS